MTGCMTNYHFRKTSKKKCCNLFDYNTSSFYLFVFSVKFIDINPSIKLLLTKNHYHFYCITLLFIKNVSLCRFSYFFIFHDSLLLYFLLKHHLSIHILHLHLLSGNRCRPPDKWQKNKIQNPVLLFCTYLCKSDSLFLRGFSSGCPCPSFL